MGTSAQGTRPRASKRAIVGVPARRPIMLHPLLAVALVSAPTHDVLVVDDDPGPGTEFATIQAAIDAAVAGDTVLVRPGT